MEAIAHRRKGASDGIHRPPKVTILFDQKEMESASNLLRTRIDQLQLQNSLRTGKQRRKA